MSQQGSGNKVSERGEQLNMAQFMKSRHLIGRSRLLSKVLAITFWLAGVPTWQKAECIFRAKAFIFMASLRLQQFARTFTSQTKMTETAIFAAGCFWYSTEWTHGSIMTKHCIGVSSTFTRSITARTESRPRWVISVARRIALPTNRCVQTI